MAEACVSVRQQLVTTHPINNAIHTQGLTLGQVNDDLKLGYFD